jgi:hypothetical protein
MYICPQCKAEKIKLTQYVFSWRGKVTCQNCQTRLVYEKDMSFVLCFAGPQLAGLLILKSPWIDESFALSVTLYVAFCVAVMYLNIRLVKFNLASSPVASGQQVYAALIGATFLALIAVVGSRFF